MLEAPQLDALEIVMVAAAQTIGSVTVLLVNATKTMLEEEALDEETETVEEVVVVVAETLAEAGLAATIPEVVDATTTMATNLPNLGAPLLHLLVSPQPKLSTVVLSIGVASVYDGQLHTPPIHTLAQTDP